MEISKRPAWAARLQAEREKRGWSKNELGRRMLREAKCPTTMLASLVRSIRDWEKGKHYPRDWAVTYARVFDMDEEALFSKKRTTKGDEEMERRKLLQALTALGVTPTPLLESLQVIHGSIDTTLGREEHRDLTLWEETLAEYGHSYLLLPPQRLLRDLATDLVAVKQAITHAEGHNLRAWYRITGGLAMLTAKTLCLLGQPRQARPWWDTALDASHMSGDTDLNLWIKGERLIHGIYDQRPPMILLRYADDAINQAPDATCRGMVTVIGARAQILAMEGRADEAMADLHRCGEIFEGLPASVTSNVHSIEGWGEDCLHYTSAWVHAYLDDTDQLDQAATQAYQALGQTRSRQWVQLNLLQSFGHIRSGDVTEGIRQAHTVYEAHPAEHRTTLITHLANQVLRAVPPASRTTPAVTAYRDLLAA